MMMLNHGVLLTIDDSTVHSLKFTKTQAHGPFQLMDVLQIQFRRSDSWNNIF
jgi:hypothetical protein